MHHVDLIMLLTIGLGTALVLGAIAHRLGLSPIVGYLFAGTLIGPATPGFIADPELTTQLAEIGVILLMFGVGLHFHVEDLVRVKGVAIPGAIFQASTATVLTWAVARMLGESHATGLILGVAVSVASTVVLVRVLNDLGLLHTPSGHIAVGWLVVEDLLTVLLLVLLPALKEAIDAGHPGAIVASLLWTVLKIAALVGLVWVVGRRTVPRVMNMMARTRSRELFTLSVLVVALGFAVGSAAVFGVSMALGAFLAGMVVAQSDVSHQAASDALPMRDAFAVLFFISVGMLLNPWQTFAHGQLLLGLLAVILIGKPLAAAALVILFGYPLRSSLVVAMALAQIGEFSFIVGELAVRLELLSEDANCLLVTCAVASITVNPFLFALIPPIERWCERRPQLAGLVMGRRMRDEFSHFPGWSDSDSPRRRAVVVGYGPVGRMLTRILREFQIDPVVIDLNIDTIRQLRSQGIAAVYGDAAKKDVLRAAGIDQAHWFVVTLPGQFARETIVELACDLNPSVKTILRAHYLRERSRLHEFASLTVAYEELEVAVALAEVLLREMGVDDAQLAVKTGEIRTELTMG